MAPPSRDPEPEPRLRHIGGPLAGGLPASSRCRVSAATHAVPERAARAVVLEPGSFHPLGATWDGRGVNFALFSEHATAVELCLFDEDGTETRVAVPWRSIHVWHVFV